MQCCSFVFYIKCVCLNCIKLYPEPSIEVRADVCLVPYKSLSVEVINIESLAV